jgi:hypothetical protein
VYGDLYCRGFGSGIGGVVRNVSFVCEIGIYKAKPKLIIKLKIITIRLIEM